MIFQRRLYTALVTAQQLLFGNKRLFFNGQLGDDRSLVSMESLERESQEKNHTANDANDAIDNNGKPAKYVYKLQIVWFNAIGFLVLHLAALYGLYLFLTSSMVLTMLWSKHSCMRYNIIMCTIYDIRYTYGRLEYEKLHFFLIFQ